MSILGLCAARSLGQQILYVDASAPPAGDGLAWGTAFNHLQDALVAALTSPGTVKEIHIAGGVYLPDRGANQTPGDRNASFTIPYGLCCGFSLRGGYAGSGATDPDERDFTLYPTVLSGDLAENDAAGVPTSSLLTEPTRADNSYHVVTLYSVTLDGLTISGGNADGNDVASRGGGIYSTGSTSTLVNCIIQNNASGTYGGGIYSTYWLELSGCTLEHNSSPTGGGMYTTYGGRMTGCMVDSNVGGGVKFDNTTNGGNVWITGCRFTGNTGSGLSAVGATLHDCVLDGNVATQGAGWSGSYLRAYNCRFLGNTATEDGGGAWNSSFVMLLNCIFVGNHARHGGGCYSWQPTSSIYGQPAVTNCTFTGNVAGERGGAIEFSVPDKLLLRNVIAWGDTSPLGPEISMHSLGGTGSLTASYNDIKGGKAGVYIDHGQLTLTWGAGNIDTDPLLVDPAGADGVLGTSDDNVGLRLQSPCLDAGDNSALPADADDVDRDGNNQEPFPFDQQQGPRFVDEPGRPDSGSGTPPIVDMGAIESIGQQFVVALNTTVPEGGTSSFGVSLALDPRATVRVHCAWASGDPDVYVLPEQELVFDSSNYSAPQQVMIGDREDIDFTRGASRIRVMAEGIPTCEIEVIEEDNEPVPAVLYVDSRAGGAATGTGWDDAFAEVQTALWAVQNRPGSAEIHVAQGTYRPDFDVAQGVHTLNRSARFQPVSGIKLMGGYAGCGAGDPDARDPAVFETVLSGDLQQNDGPAFANRGDNSYTVVRLEGVVPSTSLDGFSIRGGYYWNGLGTGLVVLNCSPQILSCRIRDNWGYGGAAYVKGSPAFSGCLFDGNRGYYSYYTFEGWRYIGEGAAAVVLGGSPRFVGCSFTSNAGEAQGGAVYNDTGTCSFADCTFSGNTSGDIAYGSGGAIYNKSGSLLLSNCTLSGNYSNREGGGIYLNGGTLKMAGCLVVGNWTGTAFESFRGGGVFANGGTVEIKNCTFAENRCSSSTAGGLYSYNVPTLANSIFWGNAAASMMSQAAQIQVTSGSGKPNISYCCVQGWAGNWGGTGNIGTDPLFTAAGVLDAKTYDWADDVWTSGDYRLLACSPCVDAGSNIAAPADMLDLDGDGNVAEPMPLDLAGRLRFVDEPTTADTGAGTPPLVDMGASEAPPFIPGDFDNDGDVDGGLAGPDDLEVLQACATGPTVSYRVAGLPAGCPLRPGARGFIAADLDQDGDVDQNDFGIFQRCYSGAYTPADPDCGR